MTRGTRQDNFRAKAPWIMALLMRDFMLEVEDAGAALGNLGHESGGLVSLQEISPTVKGSKGGYGWPMWTGPRRRAYEAYCRRNGLNPAGDEANYKYLFVELSGPEKAAIAAVKKAKGLAAKVRAFERNFERAGVKHYDSREKWAEIALDAWRACHGAPTLPAWAVRTAPAAKSPGKPADAPKAPPPATDAGMPVNAAPRPPHGPTAALPGETEAAKRPTPGKGVLAAILLALGGAATWWWEAIVNFFHRILGG